MIDFFCFGKFDSRDFAIISVSQNAYDAPQFEAEEYVLRGKNGVLFVEEDRLSNITMQYDVILDTSKGIDPVMSKFRASLLSQKGYNKLYDSKNSDIFRTARLSNIKVIKAAPSNKSALVRVEFSAKPQRFLESGNHAINVDISPSVVPSVRNPTTYQSVPIIKFVPNQAEGSISVRPVAGEIFFTLEFASLETGVEYEFDGETLDFKKSDSDDLLNDHVYSSDQLVLIPGNNWFVPVNIESLTVVPRWWEF